MLRSIALLALVSLPVSAQETLLGPTRRMLPRPASPAFGHHGVALADADGDGLDDLFVATAGGVEIWRGTDEGRFVTAGPPLPAVRDELVLIDLEGDGDPDVHVGGTKMYRNDGGGAFTDVSAGLPSSLDELRSIVSGDFDGDGDDDLLRGEACAPFGCFATELDALWRNDGAGVFTSDETVFPPGSAHVTNRLLATDVDLDGDLDPIPSDRVFLNDGTGHFTLLMTFNTYGDSGNGFVLDRDLDGDPDLLFAPGNPLYDPFLFDNDGAGGMTYVAAFSGLEANSVGVVELNGDGYPDVVVDQYSGGLRLFHNDGAGLFVDQGAIGGSGWADEQLALDADHDGDQDLVLASYVGLRLYLNDGAGGLHERTRSMPWLGADDSPVLLDVDGDGDLDLASNHVVLRNDGAGQMRTLVAAGDYTSAMPWGAGELVAFDLDGDGDSDLVDGTLKNDARAYVNAGGALNEAFVFPVGATIAAVEAADFDGDGLGDVAFGFGFQDGRLFRGTGGGSFAEVSPSPLPGDRVNDYDAADLDGDGDVDLYAARGTSLPTPDLLFISSGGSLVPGPALPAVAQTRSYAVRHGDVDQDGDLDVVLGAGGPYHQVQNTLLVNDGAAGFTDAGAFPAKLDATVEVLVLDVDVDGVLDVLFLNHDEPSRYLRGLGGGAFVEQTDRIPSGGFGSGHAVFADLDGDADPEVVLGGGVVEIWTGLRRQVAWGAVPRVGYATPVELSGSPNAPWWLAWSPKRTALPLPPLGTIFVDPTALQILDVATLDGAGRAEVFVPIPDVAALVGVEVYAQALIGNPVYLANLEEIAIEDL